MPNLYKTIQVIPKGSEVSLVNRVSTTPGNLLEFIWSSCKFLCKIGILQTALVSSHRTGYLVAYLRNWSPFFIFATAPCCAYHVFVLYLGKLGTLLSRPKQCKHVLDFY